MSDYVEMLNLCATPNGTRRSSYVWNADSRQEESGKWSYMARENNNGQGTFAFKMGVTKLNVGDVLVCIYSCDNPALLTVPRNSTDQRISGTDTTEGAVISQRMGWVAGRVATTSGVNEIWITRECGWVTLEGCAVFAAEDWEHVRSLYDHGRLSYPWFDGDTYPRSGVGGGLSLLALYPHHLELEVVA